MKKETIFEIKDYRRINNLAYATKGKQAILTKITKKQVLDDIYNINYLFTELDYENKKVIKSDRYSNKDIKIHGWEQVRDWAEDDHERFREYGSEWHSIGVMAEATILIPFNTGTGNKPVWNFKVERVPSGGCWGIESNSNEYEIREEEENQLNELGRYLKTLNVNLSFVNDYPLEWFFDKYTKEKRIFTCTVIKNGKIVNILSTEDEKEIFRHAESCKLNYGDEGISQITVYKCLANGTNELMLEYIPE